MVAFGRDLASALVANACALSRAVAAEGLDVVAADRGFTASHQVLVLTGRTRVADVASASEAASILCTPVRLGTKNGGEAEPGLRLGTCEVTRRGMDTAAMARATRLVRRLVLDGESPVSVRPDVRELLARFAETRYGSPRPPARNG